jgi:dihydroorotase-like cyclic amidohydrolase
MESVEKMLCKNPAKILNQKEPSIKEGEKANFLLFDTTYKKTLKRENSIYFNETIYGKIVNIFIKGVPAL